jgi:hypothetical protein
MAKDIDLSIIIVNYNSKEFLKNCLESIKNSQLNGLKIETIVVDNGSKDKSCELVSKKFPWAILLRNKKNAGFSKGNNLGLNKAKGKYFLLLNPDTILSPKTLKVMVDFIADNPQVGISTCRLELEDGNLDWASHRGFPTPWASFTYFTKLDQLFSNLKLFSQYHLGFKDLHSIHEIDSPAGAFFLINKQVINDIGLFDEDFFLYGEDLDFAYRAKKKGWKVIYNPFTSATHYKGISSGIKGHSQKFTTADKNTKIKNMNHFYDAMRIFYKKHYQNKYPPLVNFLALLAIELKRKIALLGVK